MLPNAVRIKAKTSYQIVYQDEIANDPDCVGLCDPNSKLIYIKKNLKKTELKKTFIHELCHAICIEYEIKIAHESIYNLEEALLKVLSLNRWID